MKVLIVDDHLLIRKGLTLAIKEIDENAEIFQAGTFDETLGILGDQKIDILLLDIDIPGGEGVLMLNKIREKRANVTILVHSGYDEEIYALPYLRGGADGFLSKKASHQEFLAAWATIVKKRKYVSPIVQELLLENIGDNAGKNSGNPLLSLSPNELKVLHLINEGKYNKEIAIMMNLKENTISTYKRRIYEKFNVTDERQLMKKLVMYS